MDSEEIQLDGIAIVSSDEQPTSQLEHEPMRAQYSDEGSTTPTTTSSKQNAGTNRQILREEEQRHPTYNAGVQVATAVKFQHRPVCACCPARAAVRAVARTAGASTEILQTLQSCACALEGPAISFVDKRVPDWINGAQRPVPGGRCRCGCCFRCGVASGCGFGSKLDVTRGCACKAPRRPSAPEDSVVEGADSDLDDVFCCVEQSEEKERFKGASDSAVTPAVMAAAAAAAAAATANESECTPPPHPGRTTTSPDKLLPDPLGELETAAVLEDLRGKRVYLFLDYDGTLTPIVPDPTRAFLPAEMRQLLVRLAPRCARVAIVTGRALRSLRQLTRISEENMPLLFAASHGFHIEAAGGSRMRHQVGAQLVPDLRAAALAIGRALYGIDGILLEDNDFAISVHFRNSPFSWAEMAVEAAIEAVLSQYPSLRVTAGKAVRELRVNVRWDKGKAVAWLLQSMGVDPVNDPNVRVLYLGDDMTDEDAFKFLRLLPRSLGLLVRDAETPLGRKSEAHFSLNGTMGVESFLRQLHAIVDPC